jgi:iron(III) transport system permease protein
VVAGLVGFVTVLALLIPVASLIIWWTRASGTTDLANGLGTALVSSLLLSLSGGLLVVLCAIPLGLLSARHPSRLGFLIERSAHLGFGLPGIVVGLALVFLSLHLVSGLYQTWVVVVVGYLVLFLALATGPIRVGFEQASVRADEAARTLGAGWWTRLRLVTLPVVAPGVISSFLLVFISTSKELPNTLLLAPPGTHTLATRVWQFTEEAMYAEAALPALVLMFLSAALVALMVWREDLLEKNR